MRRYGSVALQQQWENMVQEVSVFYVFLKNTLIFVVDKTPRSQGMTPYLDISETWSIHIWTMYILYYIIYIILYIKM